MFEINKQAFGAFVAMLRKEKGMTQKDLAVRLNISDKAISKWETGVSIPDVGILVPLAETLEVSVTELLYCHRTEATLDAAQVENIVKTAITYSEEVEKSPRFHQKGLWLYLACVAVCAVEIAVLYRMGFTAFSVEEPISTVILLCAIFGLYFMVFAIQKLPGYYDENRISAFSDGPVRMNLPGVRISNRNWPHIVRVGRIWSMTVLTSYPLLTLVMRLLAPVFWMEYEKAVLLAISLGGLFVPLVIVGRKYQ